MRDGEWGDGDGGFGPTGKVNSSKKALSDCTIGLVGWGQISKHLVYLLKPFNCKIIVYSDYLDNGVSMDDILECGIVSVHRSLRKETEKSFTREHIMKMKPGSVFINTSRGKVIDEKALVERVERGDMTFCLDVFVKEPLPRRHPFRKANNVFLTSHIGNQADSVYARGLDELADWAVL